MDRRRFLAQAGKKGSLAVAAAVSGGAAVTGGARDKARESLAGLSEEIRSLRKRIDQLDASYKKSIRALFIVTSITTGVDLITWM